MFIIVDDGMSYQEYEIEEIKIASIYPGKLIIEAKVNDPISRFLLKEIHNLKQRDDETLAGTWQGPMTIAKGGDT